MFRWSRLALFALASIATEIHAVEVALHLASAKYWDCTFHQDLHGEGDRVDCGALVAATVAPAAPQGSGSVIDLDAAGVVIRANLQLEAFSLDGVPVASWTGTYHANPGDSPTFEPELLALPGASTAGEWSVNITRMNDQSDFAGELTLSFEQQGDASDLRLWSLTLPFTAISAGAAPPCQGERLYLDDDGDGKVNTRDAASWPEDLFGDAIDSEGRTPSQFCWSLDLSTRGKRRSCERLDFANDEPMRRRPGDCTLNYDKPSADWSCDPAEFVFRSAPPTAASRTCLGFGVVDDADADGEPDATDRCPSTPSGTLIDGDGCSAAQFCSLQSVSLCRRADFRNDDPLAKRPGDCARTHSQPRACSAATRN